MINWFFVLLVLYNCNILYNMLSLNDSSFILRNNKTNSLPIKITCKETFENFWQRCCINCISERGRVKPFFHELLSRTREILPNPTYIRASKKCLEFLPAIFHFSLHNSLRSKDNFILYTRKACIRDSYVCKFIFVFVYFETEKWDMMHSPKKHYFTKKKTSKFFRFQRNAIFPKINTTLNTTMRM